ncbi:PREDICTED: uncharacterized protein LOC104814251 [Tarenaya hassleriana]|uniref:uncharacterized protein LOC104814251 n=1 Tax=Tarenaya hassleriana TaxID=28532 RepID=UPI00053C2938|nr:PREDICTED: uncharacterized protein LOC104814251 [Tarenaya hassleriana]
MEGGEGTGNWFDTLVDTIDSAIVKADQTIHKNVEGFCANVKELWSDLIDEIPNPSEHSYEDDKHASEIKEKSETLNGIVQVKKENLGHETSKSDVDDSKKLNEMDVATKYICAWFLHHTEEDFKSFVMAVASCLRSKGHPGLAAEVEKLLVGPFHVDKITSDTNVSRREEVVHRNGNSLDIPLVVGDGTSEEDETSDIEDDDDGSEEETVEGYEDVGLILEGEEEEHVEVMRKREEAIKKLKMRLLYGKDTESSSSSLDGDMGMSEEGQSSMPELDEESSDEDIWYDFEEEEVAWLRQFIETWKNRDEYLDDASSPSPSPSPSLSLSLSKEDADCFILESKDEDDAKAEEIDTSNAVSEEEASEFEWVIV